MANRSQKITNDLKQAEEKLIEANSLKLKYETSMQDIENERNRMLEIAHSQAIENKNLILKEAHAEALKIKKQAKLESVQSQKKIHDELKKQIINISWIVIVDLLKDNLDSDMHDKLNQECVKKIEKLDMKKLVDEND